MNINYQPIITKASGKILLAGGYGVLQQNNIGLSLAVSNSFYCVCTKAVLDGSPTSITIASRQINQVWHYVYVNQSENINKNTTNTNKVEITNKSQEGSIGKIIQQHGKQNRFVQSCIQWVLKYYNKQSNAGKIHLQIVFNRDFISDTYAIKQKQLNKQKAEIFPCYKPGYSKTGLGSSACVIVSIVKCLITLFNPQLQQKSPQKYNNLSNILSQISNLSAQKKLGSNFDISTAVFGSHLYKNILPYKIMALMENQQHFKNNFKQLVDQLCQIDPEIQLIQRPSKQNNVFCYIIDVNKGADTREMVKGFTNQLKKCTKQVQQYFYTTSKQIVTNLYKYFNNFHQKPINQSSSLVQQIKQINATHRQLQQQYTSILSTPIQPPILTPLLDKISNINEVMYVICPGSGGYDAIVVLASNDVYEGIKEIVKKQGHHVRKIQIGFGKCEIGEQQRQAALDRIKNWSQNN